jgi:hypothetical protein
LLLSCISLQTPRVESARDQTKLTIFLFLHVGCPVVAEEFPSYADGLIDASDLGVGCVVALVGIDEFFVRVANAANPIILP